MSAYQSAGITIIGLGPGDPEKMTRQAWMLLENAQEIFLRTCQHPTVKGFPSHIKVQSFDHFYDEYEHFEEVYNRIIERVLELGRRKEGVIYAVPGHPFVAEATSPEIVRLAEKEGLNVQVIDGLSFIEPVFTALQLDPFPKLILMDALELGVVQYPPFSPASPVLIAQIYSRLIASEVKVTLMSEYPDEHRVMLVHNAGSDDQIVEQIKLFEIDRSENIGLRTVLFLPALNIDTSFDAFLELIARLRAPDGCPWDREQTHRSLRPFLLEETYEVLSALDAEDMDRLSEELGDLLLQIVLHAQIGTEMGEFKMTEVISGIYSKIVRRHPHVFADKKVENTSGVIKTWQEIKDQERNLYNELNGLKKKAGLLESVPADLPALSQAQEIQKRADHIGFDWAEIQSVIDKVKEEFTEVIQAENHQERADELGDLLFSVVNLIRWYDVDAESALREANRRFRRRFSYVEDRASQLGLELPKMTLREMDVFWDEAKDLEK
ncbi:MAG: nucleoside triphosphate pyrophosphohydrolase [Anaerolineaceae bacterium]|nr:nucleoside triphosphate pyrophosphohydrolase [Anaerolineaceae bacterium]